MQINNKIPKTIHFCWLGKSEKPELVKKCIESWKNKLPEYEVIEWNEDNFDFNNVNNYVKEALERKRWAFVTDYMRLKVLYEYGGIYLDTDVEVIKSFDDFLNNDSFIGLESLDTICTAVIGSKKNEEWIKELLDLYDQRKFVIDNREDLLPNSKYIFSYLNTKYNIKNSNDVQIAINRLKVYPREYFSPKNYSTMQTNITKNTYSIHYYGGMWKTNKEKVKDYFLAIVTRIIGEKNREKIKIKIKG